MKTPDSILKATSNYRRKKIAQGLCSACGKRPLVNKNRCAVCQQKARDYQKMRREINIAAGLNCRGRERVR